MSCKFNKTYVIHPDGKYRNWTIRNKKWYQAYCSRLGKWIEIYTACPYCTDKLPGKNFCNKELSLF